jgi:two-component sensor histidine kinase
MGRIGELDLPDRLAPYAPAWVTQLVVGLLCTALAITLRALVDSVSPGAGPYALGLPLLVIATLFARLPAGLITATLNILFAWYFVVPYPNSFAFEDPADATRLIVSVFTSAALLGVAELFRMAVRRAASERDRQIAERDLLLEEFDHRVKNNFALVASLLDMQRRRAGDQATGEALAAALTRVESIARAHRHLYRGAATAANVDMAAYLGELCSALSEALFLRGAISLACDSDHAALPRDRAVSLGLVLNELVTNAAKHAFEGRATGNIQVVFRTRPGGWTLTVADDGIGLPARKAPKGRDGGLGQRLVEAFAKQAGGTISTESGPQGTIVTVELAA